MPLKKIYTVPLPSWATEEEAKIIERKVREANKGKKDKKDKISRSRYMVIKATT